MVVPRTPEERYGPALKLARQKWARVDPKEAAWKAGAEWVESDGAGHAEVAVLTSVFQVSHPEGAIVEKATERGAPVTLQLIILHYLTGSDGSPVAGRWVAFRELPDARWYEPAFASAVNVRLVKTFDSDVEAFKRAARTLGGDPLTFGDASFMFRVLPRLWMSLVLHRGDEEFGPEMTVLFDAGSSSHLPAEDLVYVGGYLAGQMIKAGA